LASDDGDDDDYNKDGIREGINDMDCGDNENDGHSGAF
jgi:hypothetical protein